MKQEKYIGYVELDIADIFDVITHLSCLLGGESSFVPTLVFPLKVKCHFPADLPRLSLVIPSSGLDVSTFCGGAFS
jgi:hypothetical protein